ncbi:hypothetical protein HaLaN_28751, partial [Haematococcus lacustris]
MKRLVAALAALPGVVEQRDAAFLTPLKLVRKLQAAASSGAVPTPVDW